MPTCCGTSQYKLDQVDAAPAGAYTLCLKHAPTLKRYSSEL